MTSPRRLHLDTRAVRGSGRRWPSSAATGALTTPIYASASFEIESVDAAAEILERGGRTFELGRDFVYSRGGNPTQRALEEAIAGTEDAADAVAYSSGMAAIAAVAATCLQSGDHAVVSNVCFGDTYHLFVESCKRSGVNVTPVDTADANRIAAVVTRRTRLIFVETPANPTLTITDIAQVACIAQRVGAMTVVDSTFASPVLQQPLALGCDAVVHSLTKYINGHGDAIGGIVATSNREFAAALRVHLYTTGALLDPFAAFLILRGLQTLPVRMQRHCASATAIASFLAAHPAVAVVHYPGLPAHPQHALAQSQMSGFGGVLAFEMRDGMNAARRVLSRLKLCTLAVSIGSTRTLVEYPAGMTHRIMSPEARASARIPDGLIRLSVGLEALEDIVEDLEYALE